MSHDIAIGTALLPTGNHISKKPPYLISLMLATGKTTTFEHFIALDKPQTENGLIQAKGFYANYSEEEILKDFAAIIANIQQTQIVDMQFPHHRLIKIRNLIFNANKTITPR